MEHDKILFAQNAPIIHPNGAENKRIFKKIKVLTMCQNSTKDALIFVHFSKKQNYNALPLIKQLLKENMIDKKNLTVEFQGGNVSLLTEFEDILEELSTQGCKNIIILTNGVQYLPAVEKYSSNMNFRICISLDSGTKETFNKIKRIDTFDKVVNNIKKFTSLRTMLQNEDVEGMREMMRHSTERRALFDKK